MKIPKWMLDETVQVKPYSGSGAYGPIYGDTSTVQARVEYSRELTLDAEGNEVVSETKAYFRPGVNINPQGQVYHDSNTYEVTALRKHRGLGEYTHLEVVLL